MLALGQAQHAAHGGRVRGQGADGAAAQAHGGGGQLQAVERHAQVHIAAGAVMGVDGDDQRHGRIEETVVARKLRFASGAVVARHAQGAVKRLGRSHLALAQLHGHGARKVGVVLAFGHLAFNVLQQGGSELLAQLATHRDQLAWLQIAAAGRLARRQQQLMQQRIWHGIGQESTCGAALLHQCHACRQVDAFRWCSD